MASTDHKSIHVALAAAQAEMGKLTKGAFNKHFGSKYADLSDVVEAVGPALSGNGISRMQMTVTMDGQHFVRTVLTHGASDTDVECMTPLYIGKADSHGYKSAVTYARRIGLECLTGVAPEDDDGNAAAAAPVSKIAPEAVAELRKMMEEAGVAETTVTQAAGVQRLEDLAEPSVPSIRKRLAKSVEVARAKAAETAGDDKPENA